MKYCLLFADRGFFTLFDLAFIDGASDRSEYLVGSGNALVYQLHRYNVNSSEVMYFTLSLYQSLVILTSSLNDYFKIQMMRN